jgi:hypothetical protein
MSADLAQGSVPSLAAARAAMSEHGVEVFRVDVEGETIQLAARVRSHLMDASVSVKLGQPSQVRFTVRAQNSDFPGVAADEMFSKVRQAIGTSAQSQGFDEADQHCRQIQDPSDKQRILDVWYELTFAKQFGDLNEMMNDVRWSLSISKCVGY